VSPQTYYDVLTRLLCDLFGHDWHLGYWLNAQTPAEAAQRLNEVMAGRLPRKPGMRVLDVGCGVGGPACFIAEQTGGHVTGVTNSPPGIAEGERFVRERGLEARVTFRIAEASALPFEDASFDAVWSCEALHNLADKTPAVREMARVLKPGGTAVLGDLFLTSSGSASGLAALREFSFHLETADELVALLQAHGIQVHESIDIGHHVGPTSPQLCATVCRERASQCAPHTLERIILERTAQATSLLADTFSAREIGWGIWSGIKLQIGD
jgi:cyclopropane fatty-acyl-phospholipid synthase-like methyltransferase